MKKGVLFPAILTPLALAAASAGWAQLDSAETAAPSPVPLAPTYQSLNANIFQPKCVTCHNSQRAPSGVNLSTYDSIQASAATHGKPIVVPGHPEQSPVYEMVNSGMMPPSGKLPDDEIQAIATWISQGAQNN